MRRCRVVQPIFFRSFFSPTDASRSGSPPIDRPTNQEAGFVCVCVCVCVSSDQSRLQVIFFTSTTSALWLNRNGLSAVGTVLFFVVSLHRARSLSVGL